MKEIEMKKTIYSAILLLLLSGGISVQAMAEGNGGVTFSPSIGVTHQYNDNIYSADTAKTSSHITVVNAGVEVGVESATRSVSVHYNVDAGYYQIDSADNYVTQQAGLNVSADLSSRLHTSFEYGYVQGSDPRGSTFTGAAATAANAVAEADRFHSHSVSASLDFGSRAKVGLSGAYSNLRYDNNQFRTSTRDYDTMGGGVSFSLPIMKKTHAVLEARYSKVDYQLLTAATNLDSNEQRYFVGLDWEATAKTSGSLRMGYMVKSFDDTLLHGTSKGAFSWELGVNWAPLSYSTFDLSTNGSIDEADGSGSHIWDKNANLSWNHAWSDKLSHTASVSYANKKYVGIVRADDLTTVGIAFNYQALEWLSGGIAYDYTNNSSTTANANYSTNVGMVLLKAAL